MQANKKGYMLFFGEEIVIKRASSLEYLTL